MTSASRFLLAIAASVLLHLALLAGRLPTPTASHPMRLDVKLIVPQVAQETPPPDPGVFEKNTIANEEEKPQIQAPPPVKVAPTKTAAPTRLKAAEEQSALRKLSEYVLYPQAAVDAGMEGTVHLLLKFDAQGTILHASVAAGSGHPELDHAAVQAALRAGKLSSGGKSEIILPITFRLQ